MIIIVSVYTNRGELVFTDGMFSDTNININTELHEIINNDLNMEHICDELRKPKLLVRVLDESTKESKTYIYDYDSKTILREYHTNRTTRIISNIYYHRVDLYNNNKYKYGDKVLYKKEGLIYKGTIIGEILNGIEECTLYDIEEDEDYEVEYDPVGCLDDIFFEYTEGIHVDDIIGLIE